jgi:hypothetical protein
MSGLSRRAGLCVVLAALGLALALPAAAQWKWRDKNGQTQYSDLPPPQGTPDADILQRPAKAVAPRAMGATSAPSSASAASSAALAPKLGEPSLDAKRKAAEQEAAAKKQSEEERIAIAKLDNCARARAQLKSLDEGQRIMRINAKGEREYLDDQGRAEEAQRMRGIIASDCK